MSSDDKAQGISIVSGGSSNQRLGHVRILDQGTTIETPIKTAVPSRKECQTKQELSHKCFFLSTLQTTFSSETFLPSQGQKKIHQGHCDSWQHSVDGLKGMNLKKKGIKWYDTLLSGGSIL